MRASASNAALIWPVAVLVVLCVQIVNRFYERTLVQGAGGGPAFMFWYCACILALAPVLIAIAAAVARRHRDMTLNLALVDRIEVVGDLVDALDTGDSAFDLQHKEALTRLLPRLTSDEAHLLDEYRQAQLRYFVRPPASPIYSTYLTRLTRNSVQNVSLRLAIIEALSRIGDREALTMFDEILDCRSYTANERRVRRAIELHRPVLAARVVMQPVRESLLRPANMYDSATLVRSARNRTPHPDAELPHVTEN